MVLTKLLAWKPMCSGMGAGSHTKDLKEEVWKRTVFGTLSWFLCENINSAHSQGRKQPLGCHLMPGWGTGLFHSLPLSIDKQLRNPKSTRQPGFVAEPGQFICWTLIDSAAMQQEPEHRLSSWEWISHPKILRPATVYWESWLCRIPGLWSHPEPRSLLNPCSQFGCTNHAGNQNRQTRGTMACVYLWFYSFPLRPLRFQSHSSNFKENSQHFRRKRAVVEFGAELFEFTPGGTFGSLRAHTLRKRWHKINKSGLDREPLKQRHSAASRMALHGSSWEGPIWRCL